MDERLILDRGFKGLTMDYVQRGYRDFDDYYRTRTIGGVLRGIPGWGPQANTAHYTDMFLPMAGLLYKFDGRTQVFASYAENMALPQGMRVEERRVGKECVRTCRCRVSPDTKKNIY